MKRTSLLLAAFVLLFGTSPVFAQHAHGGGAMGGPGAGAGHMGNAGANNNGPGGHADAMHSSPNEVLSHNTAIAGKIKTLTGQNAQTACQGFKDLGQCVAAAHVAKNLNIPGGFDALRAKMTGTGSVSLGKAIHELDPAVNAKSEAKKANKQAEADLNESNS
ncbi:MAG TPA: hypothetical protein VF758_05165 [Candidatus Acidoferrum sp.]